jgi:hypothetical protein
MTKVIVPAKSIAQKLIIDGDAMVLLQKACDDHDIARESMGTAANRLYSVGFRAEHLRAKDGDKAIIAIIDKAISLTMPEMARKLFAAKPVDLNSTDKAIRTAFIKNLADKRTALAKALAKCDEPDAGTTGDDIPLAEIFKEIIAKLLAKIGTASVVDPKTGLCKLEGVLIGELVKHLNAAKNELTIR